MGLIKLPVFILHNIINNICYTQSYVNLRQSCKFYYYIYSK